MAHWGRWGYLQGCSASGGVNSCIDWVDEWPNWDCWVPLDVALAHVEILPVDGWQLPLHYHPLSRYPMVLSNLGD